MKNNPASQADLRNSTCLEEEVRICYYYCACFYVSVAQGTEHRSPKAGVGGSNPLRDTMDKRRKPKAYGVVFLY